MSSQHQQQRSGETGEQVDPMEIDSDLNDHNNRHPQDIIELDDDSDDSDYSDNDDRKIPSRVRDHNHVASNSPGNISQRRRRRRIGSQTARGPAVIDLVDSPPPVANVASAPTTATTDDNGWACPQCTLLNPTTRNICDACQYRNPHIARPPDASFRDQLISDDPPGFSYSQTHYGSPFAAAGTAATSNRNNAHANNASQGGAAMFGGALLGGMMGAAGSFMNGRPVLSSAAEGAMTGAVSGAFLHEVLHSPSSPAYQRQRRRRQQQQVSAQEEMAAARSSAAMGLAGYPSMNTAADFTNSYDDDNNNNNTIDDIAPRPTRRRARPRASYRVFEERDPLTGASTTVVQAGASTTRILRPTTRSSTTRRSGDGMTDPLLSMLVHSYLQEGRRGGGAGGAGMPNPDNMNYDELLQAFGNGNDNMGASDGDIRALPCKKIEDPEKELPEVSRECLICLEDFQKDETRMTLPCLHGFHKECAQKWLRTNGSCPICKHKISTTS
ncbi:unnamed protein product [Cylindrotheca closterium]|uniref:RING-type E3 ubiquitin transferase n=1 Tax=Cylindrotheca closterium TaxID=2856 RepID=A0AAD2FLQ9_9STRA|nr:unnamed protein product [Cylindrotheca closterium]